MQMYHIDVLPRCPFVESAMSGSAYFEPFLQDLEPLLEDLELSQQDLELLLQDCEPLLQDREPSLQILEPLLLDLKPLLEDLEPSQLDLELLLQDREPSPLDLEPLQQEFDSSSSSLHVGKIENNKNDLHLRYCKSLVLATKDKNIRTFQDFFYALKSMMPETEVAIWECRLQNKASLLEELNRRMEFPKEEEDLEWYKRFLGDGKGRKLVNGPKLIGPERISNDANHNYCMRQHHAGRYHSAKATVMLLLTSLKVDEMNQAGDKSELHMFRMDFEKLLNDDRVYLRWAISFVDSENMFFVYYFLRTMSKLIAIENNREIFLLVASIVSGCGTYQQRCGGHPSMMYAIFRYMVECLNDTPWEDIPKGVRSKLSKRKASRETGNSSSDSESDRDSVGSAKKARLA